MASSRKQTVDYKLKLDPELHSWLKTHASDNYRTLSAEITMHLDQARERITEEVNSKQLTA